jgi:hypothetical protein
MISFTLSSLVPLQAERMPPSPFEEYCGNDAYVFYDSVAFDFFLESLSLDSSESPEIEGRNRGMFAVFGENEQANNDKDEFADVFDQSILDTSVDVRH